MQSLSVLIPAYNCNCLSLVEQLHSQLEQADIPYEIIVGDDGSTDTSTIQGNQPINALSHCRYIVRTENTGRASIRNFLAQTAQYEFLLLIDESFPDERLFDFLRQLEQHGIPYRVVRKIPGDNAGFPEPENAG